MALKTSFELRMTGRWSIGGGIRIVTLKTLIILFDIKVDIRRIFYRWPMHTEIISIGAAGKQGNNQEQHNSDKFFGFHF
jgi:hypothetical protein